MHDGHDILDPHDPHLVHADVTCEGLWVLVDRAEAATGRPVDDAEALLDQAHADGLLVLAGTGGGLRACAHCGASAAVRSLAAAA